jgi:hypothetical protein
MAEGQGQVFPYCACRFPRILAPVLYPVFVSGGAHQPQLPFPRADHPDPAWYDLALPLIPECRT